MKVSLICPVHNEEESIEELIQSMLNQTKKPDEIIFVEDSSTDKTYEIIEKYQKKNKLIKVFRVKTRNIAKNRNIAIKKSKGDIIFCVDAGCKLDKNYIEEILKCKNKNKSKLFFGGISKVKFKNNFERAYKELVERNIYSKNYLPKGHSFCFEKKLWIELNGFDEGLLAAEDSEFILKAKKIKQEPIICKDAIVYWNPRKNFKAVFKQFKNYGKWDKILSKRKGIGKKSFLSLIIGILFPLSIIYSFLISLKILLKSKNLVVPFYLFFLQLTKIYGYNFGFLFEDLKKDYIIIPISGGLGNQMFQYAFGKSLENKRKGYLFFDLWDCNVRKNHNGYELNKVFNININNAPKHLLIKNKGFRVYFLGKEISLKNLLRRFFHKDVYKKRCIFEPLKYNKHFVNYCLNNNVHYIHGVFQDSRYFEEFKREILKEFKFNIINNKRNNKIKKFIEISNSVSIHVRRGDYLQNKNSFFTDLTNSNYYEKSINYIIKKVKNPTFFCFSDDITYCKNKFKFLKDIHYIDWNIKNESFMDMYLMSLCKHNIIANSTFSWWGAYLNKNINKLVISPKRWYKNNLMSLSKGNLSKDFIQI